MTRVAAVLAFLLALSGARLTAANNADKLPAHYDLNTLRAEAQAQSSSIRAISAKYTIVYMPQQPTKDDYAEGPTVYEWAEQGDMKRLVRYAPDDRPMQNSFVGSDGHRGYVYAWAGAGPDTLSISESLNAGYDSNFLPSQAMGLRVVNTPLSVADLLRLPDVAVDGPVELFQCQCAAVVVHGFKSFSGQKLVARILLDIEHDYVPRRIAVYGDGQTYERWHQTWDVESLQQVRDELAGAFRWVPKSAVFVQPGREHRMEMTDIALNVPIDPALFSPKALPGTMVADLINGKSYVLGGRDAARGLIDSRVQRARDEIAAADGTTSSPTPYNARPQSATFRWKLVSALSLAILIAAFAVYVRRAAH